MIATISLIVLVKLVDVVECQWLGECQHPAPPFVPAALEYIGGGGASFRSARASYATVMHNVLVQKS